MASFSRRFIRTPSFERFYPSFGTFVRCTQESLYARQGGRGHWAVYYTSPPSFIITFSIRWLKNFGDYYKF